MLPLISFQVHSKFTPSSLRSYYITIINCININESLFVDNFIILNREELFNIPWMNEVHDTPNSKLFINDHIGLTILNIDYDGEIAVWEGGINAPVYILQNINNPSELVLRRLVKVDKQNDDNNNDDDDDYEYFKIIYENYIKCVTVSTNFVYNPDGTRTFFDGPNKYYYD